MFDQLGRSVNLRDLGGHRTALGGRVRRGRVYRSAALSALEGDALETVRALGVRTIVDLRHNAERAAQPTPWEAIGCTDYWCRDHHDSGADLGTRLRNPALTAADCRAAMADLYRALPYAQVEAYRRLFRALGAGEGPVLFHCAVGKDRTGVAAALILAMLGVPRAAIVADYALTEQFDLLGSPHVRDWPASSEERMAAFAPLFAIDAGYLDAMFETLAARSGSVEAYVRETLGLDDREISALVAILIEPEEDAGSDHAAASSGSLKR